MKTVLLIDDQKFTSPHTHPVIPKSPFIDNNFGDYRLINATSPGDALEKAAVEQPDLILLNINIHSKAFQNIAGDLKKYRLTRSIPIMVMNGNHPKGNLQLNTDSTKQSLNQTDYSWILQTFAGDFTRKSA